MKTISKILSIIAIALIVILIINFIPTFNLSTNKMNVIEGNWVNVFYEKEENSAQAVFELADKEAKSLASKLGFYEKQNVNIYIYDNQETMQGKKYGLFAPLLGLDWYIGDNIGTNVILTSPANPGKEHNSDSIINAVLHEMVHAFVSVLNPDVRLWLKEGVALYLTNGEPFYKEYLLHMTIPTYSETNTKNPITFANIGGYSLAHTYIEYIDVTYGWDSVLEIIMAGDYEKEFGKSQEDLYIEWINYIKNYYQ